MDASSPSHITTHAFVPDERGWWSLCAVEYVSGGMEGSVKCNMAEAAHERSTQPRSAGAVKE